MRRVLILGAGDHGQVVADILLRMQEAGEDLSPLGFLDDDPRRRHQPILGLPVLGGVDALPTIDYQAAIVAIGDNRTRQRLFEQLQGQGVPLAIARHPSAVVAPDAQIGPGTMISAGAVVSTGSIIGANVILNTACTVDHHSRVGDHAHLAPGVHLSGSVTIGEGALVAISATVIPRRTVGAWATVGAGAVVIHDVPDGATVAGVPAEVIKDRVWR